MMKHTVAWLACDEDGEFVKTFQFATLLLGKRVPTWGHSQIVERGTNRLLFVCNPLHGVGYSLMLD
jgi:hypothetical protein